MYIYIDEGNDVSVKRSIGEGDLQSVEVGYLTIIDITDPLQPKWPDGEPLKIED